MLTKEDIYLFHEGKLTEGYRHFGAHVKENGVEFCVYAPNAREAFIPGDFNDWHGGDAKMEKIDDSGIFYLYIGNAKEWDKYKYEFHTYQGDVIFKTDPFGYYCDLRPRTDSKICNIEGYVWNDQDFIENRKSPYHEKMIVYEMHMGSWKQDENGNVNFRRTAEELIPYLKKFGYTHLELMPIYEFPCDDSWGYQGTGYYAVTSRFGSPKDYMFFIDQLHQAGIYVIMDWVPGHTCKDAHGLYRFDGSFLFEYEDSFKRENVTWGTANFDFSKGSVRSFMISNAIFWMRKYHIDGFRVDAVSNLFYYLGNPNNGTNQEAIYFLRTLSQTIFGENPNVLLMAEDSSAFPGVTHPVYDNGIGFNYKWNMGWMNDTLKYFELDPVYRKYHHYDMTFASSYAYSENFILPLSHDEVVHLKKSLLNKMPGDYWQKFANYRALLGFMITHPGKKLLFMGAEFGQFSEWNFKQSLDWNLLDYESHRNLCTYVEDLFTLYRNQNALYYNDHDPKGFSWIEADNCDQSIFIYTRLGRTKKDRVIVVLNCTPNCYHQYKIGVPEKGTYKELLNSDSLKYGGSNQYNGSLLEAHEEPMHHQPYSIDITVAPLSICIFKKTYTRKSK